MAIRRLCAGTVVCLLLSVSSAFGASYRTTNFVVDAPTDQLARQFGDAAERFRREKAIEWLGQEMPNWQRPCPLRVEITHDGPSGATTFDFGQRPISQHMKISGPKERLLNSVLPHEVTHTVFAYYFQQPVPRWADEGGSVLSEDDIERGRHDQMCRQLLNQGRAMRLHYLFNLKEYPSDVMVLYAQGFSIARYLIDMSDRQTFLQFVQHGMRHGWDQAANSFYRTPSLGQLETAWIDSLRKPRTNPGAIASTTGARPAAARGQSPDQLTGRRVMRSTDPPALPDLSLSTPRASGAALGAPGERFGSAAGARPGMLPNLDGPPEPPLPAPKPIAFPHQPARLGTPSLGPRLK